MRLLQAWNVAGSNDGAPTVAPLQAAPSNSTLRPVRLPPCPAWPSSCSATGPQPNLFHTLHPLLQVLHARTCTGTEHQLVHLVAACHLIFSVWCDNMHMALDLLPSLRTSATAGSTAAAKRPSGGLAGWGLASMDSSSSLAATASGGRASVLGSRAQ